MTSSKSIGCWPSEIVHGKAQLMPVAADLPLRPLVLRADAGVADEDIEPVGVGEHALGEFSRFGQRRQIGLIEHRRYAASALDVSDHGVAARSIPAMKQHLGALPGELRRDIAADAIGRAGDEDGLAFHVHPEMPLTAPARRSRPI
jgi:hypothetical protein